MLYFYISFGMLLLAGFIFLLFFSEKKYRVLLFLMEAVLSMVFYIFLCGLLLSEADGIPRNEFRLVRPVLSYLFIFIVIKTCSGLKISVSVYLAGWAYLLRELCYDFGEIAGSYLKLWEDTEVHTFSAVHIFIYSAVYTLTMCLILYQKNKMVKSAITQKQVVWSVIFCVVAILLKIFSLSPVFHTQQLQDSFFVMILGWLLFALLIMYQQYTVEQEMLLRVELSVQERLWKEREAQMWEEKGNQEVLNRKYHDLKRYIAYLRTEKDHTITEKVLDELEDAVRKADISIHTGNEILDTILMEKSLKCEHKNITMTCIAEGKLLSGMENVDLYVMFSNILDNAIQYLEKLEDLEKRLLSVAVFKTDKFVKIQVENYCEKPPIVKDGNLVTTKLDKVNHGLGLKSIRSIAEKYNGNVSTQWENEIFILNILFLSTPMKLGRTSYEEKMTD